MIRSLAFRRTALVPAILAIDCRRQLRKAEDPSFAQVASPYRVGARDPATSQFREEASANSDELGGFLGGYERFGHHDNSSVRRHRISA
jgi:hypothetical protein